MEGTSYEKLTLIDNEDDENQEWSGDEDPECGRGGGGDAGKSGGGSRGGGGEAAAAPEAAEEGTMGTMLTTASMRKTLIGLFLLMGIGVMVVYWNQDGVRPMALVQTVRCEEAKVPLVQVDQTPSELLWTYECVQDKCVRRHYFKGSSSGKGGNAAQNNQQRVPYLSCAMTCGTAARGVVVPNPTIKYHLGSHALNFGLETIHSLIITPHKPVEKLLREAVLIFLQDLQVLQKDLTAAAVEPNDGSTSESIKRNARNVADVGAEGNSFSFESKCKTKHCDIETLNVRIQVATSDQVHLSLDADEKYNLTMKFARQTMEVNISATTFFGARHGLQTLSQLIWFDDELGMFRILDEAVIEDAPKFRYRGLMLDTSRHFFSVAAIKRTLMGMAHSKLNRFHWHLTDSQSFPYRSKYYPQMAQYGAYSNEEVYSPEDVKEVVEYARVRGIQVIVEIDAPAHAGNGWDWGPKFGMGELSLCINQQPWNFYCGEPPCGQLNPKNNNTYTVLEKLYQELLQMTGPVDFFHLGGDEVNLECWGQHFNDTDLRGLWCDFMLQAYGRLRKANGGGGAPKYTMVWSSGLTASQCLSKESFVVQVWGGSTWQENYDLINSGFNVIISHVDAWYLDCGFGSWRSLGEAACSPYRSWQNVYKHRPWTRMRLTEEQTKQVLGGEACLWTEQVDESVLDARVWPRATALGERLWSDPDDELDFDVLPRPVFKRMSMFRNRLVALGIKAEPIFPKYCAQNEDECV